MRFVNLVFYVALSFILNTYTYADIITGKRVSPIVLDSTLSDRKQISVYKIDDKFGGGYVMQVGTSENLSFECAIRNGKCSTSHATAQAAYNDYYNDYLNADRSIDCRADTLSCFNDDVGSGTGTDSTDSSSGTSTGSTGSSSGTNTTPSSDSNTGASSNNSSSGNSSGSSGGSGEGSTSGSGSGSTSGSTTETQGLPDSLPIPETNDPAKRKAFEDLRKRYALTFQSLKEDEIKAKTDLAICLDRCVLVYGKSSRLPICSKGCHSGYDSRIKLIQERFERLQKQMNEDIQKIMQSSNIGVPSVPNFTPDLSIPDISVSVSSDGSGGTSVTNNSSETTNINNTTNVTNNNTSVNGGVGGGTTNVTVNTKDYSGVLGGIRSGIDTLAQKIDGLTKEQECKEGTLGCAELGNLNDVKLNDENFEINKEEVDVSQNFVFRKVVGGSSSCPKPIQVNTSIFNFVISYDLVCKYANLIRGFVLLAFSVVALRIALKEA